MGYQGDFKNLLKMYRLTKVTTRAATLRVLKPVTGSPRVSLPVWQHGTRYATRALSTSRPLMDRAKDAQSHLDLGTEYLNKGSIDMAMNSYHQSVQIAPSSAGYFNIGICYFQMGKHKDAIQAFEKSLGLQPHNADAHTNIANCYLMLKDIKSGVKHLEQATNFNPLDGEAQYNLGCVYDAMGETDKALLRLQMASDAGIAMATKKLKQVKAKAAKQG
ncbi:hypothetical protein INT43_008952 [Umbelopsis isabellina]|uniref:Uncharacterized protein n=1 Tax=Mortierella isabellina TaxID=91625 RepID=A0A8H7PXP5_MORIS|nr:hypothetical protein INT43_008952 [Umbelopsis isabellina]